MTTPSAPQSDPQTEQPTHASLFTLEGHAGALSARHWEGEDPAYVVLLAHGYGEHVGRYEWVAAQLVADGAAVYGVDHVGHGRSEGERVVIDGFEGVVDDLRLLEERARAEHPQLPVVLLGHSMGGLIAARYAQRFGADLAAVVLSGPVLGSWQAVTDLAGVEDIPDEPIDPSTLSRDPEVGQAYVDDPLVWHGPFKRPTLDALQAALDAVDAAGAVDTVPMLWLHGEDDRLVPIEPSRAGWARISGPDSAQKSYPGARHEILNETNRAEVLADVLVFVRAHLPAG